MRCASAASPSGMTRSMTHAQLALSRLLERRDGVGVAAHRAAHDRDAMVVEVKEIDRHDRPAMRAGGDQPAIEAERLDRRRDRRRIGDVVVDDIDAFSAGERHDLGLEIGGLVVDRRIGAELQPHACTLVRAGAGDDAGAEILGDLNANGAKIASGAQG